MKIEKNTADYALYLEERSICFSREWSQTNATVPRRLIERAGLMFETVQGHCQVICSGLEQA
ncbi:hypothetical protein ACFORG_03915 [Lutimaribacter marinistellae]|uniref:Uncharacterized protein n=1 Tax=Lutimaribacter marinistellae TaxID=1820329 RepID=A0ABV7TBK6_9RHOB